jgi:hypothetical protein
LSKVFKVKKKEEFMKKKNIIYCFWIMKFNEGKKNKKGYASSKVEIKVLESIK